MNIYVWVFIFLLSISLFEMTADGIISKKFKNILNVLTILPASLVLIFLAGLRSINVGFDTDTYFFDYGNVFSGLAPSSTFEPGYRAIEIICARLNFSVTTFMIFVALITFILFTIFLLKFSPLPALSLTYYYARYFMARDLNEIRQSLAAMFALWSIKYMSEQKFAKFMFVVLLGAMFHKVTLIMIIPYVIIKFLKFQKNICIKYCISLIGCALLSIKIVPNFLKFLSPYLGNKVAYLTYSGYATSQGLLNPVLIFEVILSFLLIYILKNKKQLVPMEKYIMTVYVIGSLVLVLFSQYGVIGGRTSSMLTTVECIVIVYIAKYLIPHWSKMLFLMLLTVIIFYIINIYSQSINDYLPYLF